MAKSHAKHTCKVAVQDAKVHAGWRVCEQPAITALDELRQFTFPGVPGAQMLKYLCVDHTESGVMLPKPKEDKKSKKEKAA